MGRDVEQLYLIAFNIIRYDLSCQGLSSHKWLRRFGKDVIIS